MRVSTKITLSFQVTVLALVAMYAYVTIWSESHTLRITLESKLSAVARETIAELGAADSAPRVPLPGVAVRRSDPSIDLPIYPGDERLVEHKGWLELSRGFVTRTGVPSAVVVTQSLAAVEDTVFVTTLWTICAALAILLFATFYSATAAARIVGAPIDELVRDVSRDRRTGRRSQGKRRQ